MTIRHTLLLVAGLLLGANAAAQKFEGLAGSAQDAKLYLAAHSSPHIDYLTYHLWPKNWGWFDSKDPSGSW